MFVVGITGGIGSGKSTVAGIFKKEFGIEVYVSDKETKRMINENEDVRRKIIAEFGEKSFEGGVYNTKYIGGIVFGNKKKLYKLNDIIHPEVKKDFEKWCKKQTSEYVILESAILFESGMDEICDIVLGVWANEETRKKRVCARDGASEEEVEKRIKNQQKWDNIEKLSDFVIENEEKSNILKKICNIHFEILKRLR